jgi:cyanophycinase
VGIDEDTAIVVEANKRFHVLGSGSVYVLDGTTVSRSNIAEEEGDQSLSIFGVTMHVLSKGDAFDLIERQPSKLPARKLSEMRKQEEAMSK